jgi:hypothetical protein
MHLRNLGLEPVEIAETQPNHLFQRTGGERGSADVIGKVERRWRFARPPLNVEC